MACLAMVIGVLLAVRRRWILLAGWVAAFAGGGLLEAVLKVVIQRPRPPDAADYLWRTSWSFPSGHAMGSLIGYGMLAYIATVYWVHPPRQRLLVVFGASLVILSVGLSRLYLGVHYFSDVIAGYAAGAVWLSACISGLDFARSPRIPR
jgi:undecaprenyl-diphosphatase